MALLFQTDVLPGVRAGVRDPLLIFHISKQSFRKILAAQNVC